MKNCRDSAFTQWVGSGAASLSAAHVRNSGKKICSTCLSKESIPAISFGNPLPTRSLSSRERQYARQLCITLWLHHAHPFVAAEAKNLSHTEKQRVWSRSCGLEDLLQYTDCAPMWLRPAARVNCWVGSRNPTRTSSSWMYELWISDRFEWFFTLNFLYPKLCPRSIQATHACHSEVLIRFFWFFWDGQPFSRTCLLNVRFFWHVCFKNPFLPFFFAETFNSWRDQRVCKVENWVGSHNPAQTSSGSMFELWISDVFEWFLPVNFLYPNLLSSLDPRNSCPSQWVSIRFFGLWSPRPFVVASCKSGPHVSMSQNGSRNEELSRLSF